MPNIISEDDIEQAILQKLQQHGFQLLNCYTAAADNLNDRSHRTDKRDVILVDRLQSAALRLNPNLPAADIDRGLAQLTNNRSAMSTIAANREIYELIRDGIPITYGASEAIEYENTQGRKEQDRIQIIDFQNQHRNEFLAVSQLWIKGEHTYRRPDILLYINGLPLVFIELKNSNIRLQTAYDDNLNNYK